MRKKLVITDEYISTFCMQLKMLIHTGMNLADGVAIMAQDEGRLTEKEFLQKLCKQLDSGSSLSQALKEEKAFPDYVIYMIETGEKTGRTEETLESLGAYYESRQSLQNRVRAAVFYPTLLLVLMLLVIGVLLTEVLPIFDRVYQQLGGNLSGMAAGLLTVGYGLKHILPGLAVVMALVVFLLLLYFYDDTFKNHVQRKMSQVFRNRKIYVDLELAHFINAFTMGMKSGLNGEEAMHMAMNFVNPSSSLQKKCEAALLRMEAGESVGVAFSEEKILKSLYCRMFMVGLKSGSADEMLETICRRINEEVEEEINEKVAHIEPSIVVVSSILVGLILLSVMIPLMNIMSMMG